MSVAGGVIVVVDAFEFSGDGAGEAELGVGVTDCFKDGVDRFLQALKVLGVEVPVGFKFVFVDDLDRDRAGFDVWV